MHPKVIGLIAHIGKPGAAEVAAALLQAFKNRSCEVLLERATSGLLGSSSVLDAAELSRRCDIVVALGGDGTLLQVVHDVGESDVPIFGINLGSLGFLTCLSSDSHREAVDAICDGSFNVSRRAMLDVEVKRRSEIVSRRTGLNDAVISRGCLPRLIKLEARVDGAMLTEYSADGLIIATPTGSTAYSLAAGGPILQPDSGVFVVTPISPHVLTNRSVILSDIALLEIVPKQADPEVFLTVDGQNLLQLEAGDVIHIKKAARKLPLAMLPGVTFFEVLRQKLKWSGSAV